MKLLHKVFVVFLLLSSGRSYAQFLMDSPYMLQPGTELAYPQFAWDQYQRLTMQDPLPDYFNEFAYYSPYDFLMDNYGVGWEDDYDDMDMDSGIFGEGGFSGGSGSYMTGDRERSSYIPLEYKDSSGSSALVMTPVKSIATESLKIVPREREGSPPIVSIREVVDISRGPPTPIPKPDEAVKKRQTEEPESSKRDEASARRQGGRSKTSSPPQEVSEESTEAADLASGCEECKKQSTSGLEETRSVLNSGLLDSVRNIFMGTAVENASCLCSGPKACARGCRRSVRQEGVKRCGRPRTPRSKGYCARHVTDAITYTLHKLTENYCKGRQEAQACPARPDVCTHSFQFPSGLCYTGLFHGKSEYGSLNKRCGGRHELNRSLSYVITDKGKKIPLFKKGER